MIIRYRLGKISCIEFFIKLLTVTILFSVVFLSCKKGTEPNVKTLQILEITQTTAIAGGNVINEGSSKLIHLGICWSTNENPTINDFKAHESIHNLEFTIKITNLKPNTIYYLRAFASNKDGTGYGEEFSFITKSLEKATLITNNIISKTATSITFSGTITSDGGSLISEMGACCGLSSLPTIEDKKVNGLESTGHFTGTIRNLQSDRTYFLRVYAINSQGISYGNEISFSTCNCNQVQDHDGNNYNTVLIGDQVWMVENLKTTKYNDGEPIPYVPDKVERYYLRTPSYVWYNDDVNYKDPYGALYTYYTVATGKLCPLGWHVPSVNDFQQLIEYLGGEAIAGGKLKEEGVTHWAFPNSCATNESGFAGLPGGLRGGIGPDSQALTTHGVWWSMDISLQNATASYILDLYNNQCFVGFPWGFPSSSVQTSSHSVRCIKDN